MIKVLILFLCILAMSCQSSPLTCDPPAMWPQPPDPEGEVFLLQEDCIVPAGVIVMSRGFWDQLVTYIIAMETMREQEQQVLKTVYR